MLFRSVDLRLPAGPASYPPAMQPILSVANVSKTYASGFHALKGIDLTIRCGKDFAAANRQVDALERMESGGVGLGDLRDRENGLHGGRIAGGTDRQSQVDFIARCRQTSAVLHAVRETWMKPNAIKKDVLAIAREGLVCIADFANGRTPKSVIKGESDV